MKALVLKAYNQFACEDVPEPEPGENEVLIRVQACGICGSDIHGMDGSTGRRRPPIIMGHEAAGVIARCGKQVREWREGERVTFDSTVYCGTCWHCRRGEINLCDRRRVLGVSCEEYRQHGAFAEYVAVPQHILYRLPEGVSFEQAAMVEALSIAMHAVERTPIHLNDSVLVVGTGMIGLLLVQVLRTTGCGRIIALDLDQEKLQLAARLGADFVFQADQANLPAVILKLLEGRGADLAFEVVGGSPSLQMAVACLRKGGTLTLVGNLSPKVDLPLQTVVTRQLSLIGSCASAGEYPACLDFLSRGKVKVEPLISASPPLAEGAAWFQRLYRKEKGLMKVILKP
jgi:L-iditol 2-dehydrogenase